MYILIDLNRMEVLHKHPLLETIANLGWIECQNAPYLIYSDGDALGVLDFTDMELTMLYRSLTGFETNNFSRPVMLQVLSDLIMRVPKTKANPIEADMQASYVTTMIDAGHAHRFKYVKGSSRPGQVTDLFYPPALTAEYSEAEVHAARSGKLPALTPPKPVAAPPRAAPPKATPLPRATSTTAPRQGSTRSIVWAEADKILGDSPLPTEKGEITALRKRIMDELESDQQISKARSGPQLSKWYKSKAPS